jgi:putative membrane-bound dehydrogenase-like protein
MNNGLKTLICMTALAAAMPAAAQEDQYKHAGLSGPEAVKAMTLPPGFSASLFAAEPDIRQPIALCLDDRGRVWIAEAYSYPQRQPEGQGKDRIVILEDTDGDGKHDKKTVFLENGNLISGLEVGFGGVWVGAAPHLLFYPDKDGDDKPDGEPQVMLDGWGFEDTHETLNAFIWGPDGWLYGCHGVFTHSKVGKPGTPDDQRVRLNAGIWRFHPTKHVFEVFAEGTSNPWGVDFNDHGQAFATACVIPHLWHIIQGARYQRQAGNHFNPFIYEDIKQIGDHVHYSGSGGPHAGNNRSDASGGGHAHCGAMIYLGDSWPAAYRNQIFMSNIHGQRINMDQLERTKGSGYVGRHGPDFLLSNDRWSQMLNLRYGPDGSVVINDWYDSQACHTGNPGDHDRSNGRIFRIQYKGAKKPAAVDLAKASDDDLVDHQLHKNDWYVRHARRLLQERKAGDAVHSKLEKIAFSNSDETRNLRGLWALHVTGGLTEPRAMKGLAHAKEHVRAWTVQLLTEDRAPSTAALKKFAAMAKADRSPVVRLYLAAAAQRLPLEQRWELVEALAARAEDADDPNLPLMVWWAAEPLAAADAKRAAALIPKSKLPAVRAFMSRRLAAR